MTQKLKVYSVLTETGIQLPAHPGLFTMACNDASSPSCIPVLTGPHTYL